MKTKVAAFCLLITYVVVSLPNSTSILVITHASVSAIAAPPPNCMWFRVFRGLVSVLGHILSSKGGDVGFYRLVLSSEMIPLNRGYMVSDQVLEGHI